MTVYPIVSCGDEITSKFQQLCSGHDPRPALPPPAKAPNLPDRIDYRHPDYPGPADRWGDRDSCADGEAGEAARAGKTHRLETIRGTPCCAGYRLDHDRQNNANHPASVF